MLHHKVEEHNMAGFGEIPIPKQFSSMGELAELLLKKRALKAEEPLQQAKAREANMMASLYAKAAGLPVPKEEKPEPSILQKIMAMFQGNGEEPQTQGNQAMGQGGPQSQLTPEGQQNASAAMQQNGSYVLRPEDIAADKMNRQQLVNQDNQGTDFFQRMQGGQQQPGGSPQGLPETPEAKQAREVLQHLDKWKETPSEQEAREVSTAWKKGVNKNTVDLLGDWGKRISASREMLPILEHNQEIMSSPAMQKIFSNPEYFGIDKAYAKKFSRPNCHRRIKCAWYNGEIFIFDHGFCELKVLLGSMKSKCLIKQLLMKMTHLVS